MIKRAPLLFSDDDNTSLTKISFSAYRLQITIQMPNLKSLTKKLRQEIVSYLIPFPTISSSLAFRLATFIFANAIMICSYIRLMLETSVFESFVVVNLLSG